MSSNNMKPLELLHCGEHLARVLASFLDRKHRDPARDHDTYSRDVLYGLNFHRRLTCQCPSTGHRYAIQSGPRSSACNRASVSVHTPLHFSIFRFQPMIENLAQNHRIRKRLSRTSPSAIASHMSEPPLVRAILGTISSSLGSRAPRARLSVTRLGNWPFQSLG